MDKMQILKSIQDNCIYYLEAVEDPLSADVGIIRGQKYTWFYDVGNCSEARMLINSLPDSNDFPAGKILVLSHFHPDHIGNLIHLTGSEPDIFIYQGENTYKYTNRGRVVAKDLVIEDGNYYHLFALPSSHAKGSVGLEINEEYAFLGDATYATRKNGITVYNAQILLEEIKTLKAIKAPFFLLSHHNPFVVEKQEVLEQLEEIYSHRRKDQPYIELS